MIRGVPIPKDPIVLARMISWLQEEQLIEFKKTLLIVGASLASQGADTSVLSRALKDYSELVFPKNQDRKRALEDAKELLDSESTKTYTVKDISNRNNS